MLWFFVTPHAARALRRAPADWRRMRRQTRPTGRGARVLSAIVGARSQVHAPPPEVRALTPLTRARGARP